MLDIPNEKQKVEMDNTARLCIFIYTIKHNTDYKTKSQYSQILAFDIKSYLV